MARFSEAGKSFGTAPHDHRRCVKGALDKAASLCERRGSRLTALRRRVLELVWGSHEPVGAYALLEQLRREGMGSAPPTVYRALDFLREHGLVHRIESLNAFVGCAHPELEHRGQFLICTGCGGAAEIEDPGIGAAVSASAAAVGFTVDRFTIELQGLCPRCSRESGRSGALA